MKKHHRFRRRHGTATVSIHVRDLARIFNSLDPSPFWDRDLDRDAAQFIEEEFSDKRAAEVWHLNVHASEDSTLSADLQKAVHTYYTRLAASARRELREHMKLAQLGLVGGMVIFALSMGLRELFRARFSDLPRALDEGLIILAWLALWRPAEVFAYEWIPIFRKHRLYVRLAGIRVSVRSEVPQAHASAAGPGPEIAAEAGQRVHQPAPEHH